MAEINYKLKNGKEPAKGERCGSAVLGGLYALYMQVYTDLAVALDKTDVSTKKEANEYVWKTFWEYLNKALEDPKYTDRNQLRIDLKTVDVDPNHRPEHYGPSSFWDRTDKNSKASVLIFVGENVLKIDSKPTDAGWELDKLFDGLYGDDYIEEGNQLCKRFAEYHKRLREIIRSAVLNDINYIDISELKKGIESYIDAYYKIMRFVLKPEVVSQQGLLNPSVLERLQHLETQKTEDGILFSREFSLLSPVVLDSVYRTLEKIAENCVKASKIKKDSETANSNRPRGLHRSVLAHNGVMGAEGYTTYKEKSCRRVYSQRSSGYYLLHKEMMDSNERFKPIRLFRKIQAMILLILEDEKSTENPVIELTVSVVGFVHTDANSMNPEIEDLLYEVYSWYEDYSSKDKNPRLNLVLQYFLTNSTADSYTYEYDSNGSNLGQATVKFVSKKQSEYNRKFLDEILMDSSSPRLLFLLDCPWMYREVFDRRNFGYMDDFYYSLPESYSPKEESNTEHSTSVDMFINLNDQFNRISNEQVLRSGRVVRELRDEVMMHIKSRVKSLESKNEKDEPVPCSVYVYTSSESGLQASKSLRDYPIMRFEQYNQKKYYIIRFSNQSAKAVSEKKEGPLYISLNSLMNYVSVDYQLDMFKEWFAAMFHKYHKEGFGEPEEDQKLIRRDCLSIFRNILFQVDVSDFHHVALRLRFGPALWEEENCYFKKINDVINSEAGQSLCRYFKDAIEQYIFGKFDRETDLPGVRELRDAFDTCVQNQATSVRHLAFLFLYRTRRENNELKDMGKFKSDGSPIPQHDDEKREIKKALNAKDALQNKMLYKKLFEQYSRPRRNGSVLAEIDRVSKEYFYNVADNDVADIDKMTKQVTELLKEMGEYRNEFEEY